MDDRANDAREPDLAALLRSRTHAAHEALERDLALLEPPLSQARFRRALERFRGFHAAWEPAMAARPDMRDLFAGRERLAVLDADLRRMGEDQAGIDALPTCPSAAALAADRPAALGGLYVMEGSTLGGQVIARRLAETSWAPSGGLVYFHAHGERTGERWRAVKAALADVPPDDRPAVVQGALRAFETLRAWVAAPA